jgi:hypothetical protein
MARAEAGAVANSATPEMAVAVSRLCVRVIYGSVVEWLRLDEAISQLFDVAVLPMMRAPTGVSPASAQLHETITFEETSTTGAEERSAGEGGRKCHFGAVIRIALA